MLLYNLRFYVLAALFHKVQFALGANLAIFLPFVAISFCDACTLFEISKYTQHEMYRTADGATDETNNEPPSLLVNMCSNSNAKCFENETNVFSFCYSIASVPMDTVCDVYIVTSIRAANHLFYRNLHIISFNIKLDVLCC